MLNSLFNAIDISATGLSVERARMNIISENLANVDTTRTEDGGPYRRKIVLQNSGVPGKRFAEIISQRSLDLENTSAGHKAAAAFVDVTRDPRSGVYISKVVDDPSPLKMVYDPYHPDADENGYVQKPNVNMVQEMTDMITVGRNFDANVTAINASKEMIRKAIKIGG